MRYTLLWPLLFLAVSGCEGWSHGSAGYYGGPFYGPVPPGMRLFIHALDEIDAGGTPRL
jgi:hypothetical protein